MNKQLRTSAGKSARPKKSSTTNPVKRRLQRFWKLLTRKKAVLVDIAVFAAAVGTIFAFGDTISEAFVEQLPSTTTPAGLQLAPVLSVPE